MPYVLLHEDIFIGGVGILIIALLIIRLRVSRQRRSLKGAAARAGSSIHDPNDTPPRV